MKIKLSEIKSDPNQPRKIFNEKSVENLSKSLKIEGLIHPIEVDSNYMIIVGEMRYKAAKLLGWTEIEVNVHNKGLPPYERLRRQMAENLQQSGAKGGGESMNAVDTASAWVKLYELKTGKSYEPGSQLKFGGKGTGQVKGTFLAIAEEVGVDKHTVWEYLALTSQPSYVLEDVSKGRPRTYYREADKAPKEIRNIIKKKIAKGEYQNRSEVERDIQIAKKIPDLQPMIIARKQDKESTEANKILNAISVLSLVLVDVPLSNIAHREQGIIIKQLQWMRDRISSYLSLTDIPAKLEA